MMMIFPLLTQISTFTSFLMKRTVPNRVSSGIKVRIERDDVNFYFKWAAITALQIQLHRIESESVSCSVVSDSL